MPPRDELTLLNVAALCGWLGISKRSYYRLRAEGKTPRARRLGSREVFLATDVEKWVQELPYGDQREGSSGEKIVQTG